MSADYAPGTVAVISDGQAAWRASRDGKGWASLDPGIGWVEDAQVTDIRPLVVLDPDSHEDAARLLAAYGEQYTSWTPSMDGVNVDRLQEALRSLVKPPRIPEPELWGVVVAGCRCDTERLPWVAWGGGSWKDRGGDVHTWDELIDPVLIREGVTS